MGVGWGDQSSKKGDNPGFAFQTRLARVCSHQRKCSIEASQLPPVGLLGGHSGLNIAEGRGNAVKMAAEILDALLGSQPQARLASLRAGDKRNALAREANAVVYVSSPPSPPPLPLPSPVI